MYPPISTHSWETSSSDPHRITNSPDSSIILLAKDFSIAQINNMVVLHGMICDSRFRKFTLRMLSRSTGAVLFTTFHSLGFFLTFTIKGRYQSFCRFHLWRCKYSFCKVLHTCNLWCFVDPVVFGMNKTFAKAGFTAVAAPCLKKITFSFCENPSTYGITTRQMVLLSLSFFFSC